MRAALWRVSCATLFALAMPAGANAQGTDTAFPPHDEAAGDPSWTRFRDRLLTAVQQRDRKYVMGMHIEPRTTIATCESSPIIGL